MQSLSGQGTTVVHVSPKNHTILQQNDQISGRPATSGIDSSVLQTNSNSGQTIYPSHYIEAIAEQTVYASNGNNNGILDLKPGTPLRKLFASVSKSLSGQYQEYTPIIYAPVSGGPTYYQTATGQVLATAFGGVGANGPGAGGLHGAAHGGGVGHAQLVTHQGATYLVQSGQLEDDSSAISHTAKASPVTVQWLVDNYETAEGVSLPRSTLYFHYLQHCNEHKLEPMNPASFGKLIRSVFYGLRTRRLGTRGNSKYHYYGIRIKPNSPLNHFIEDAGFSLRHYPNYHRQTMEAAAEWKNFANSSISCLNKASLSSNSTVMGLGGSYAGSQQQQQHSTTNSLLSVHHGASSHGSHFNSSTRTEKSSFNSSYPYNLATTAANNSSSSNNNNNNANTDGVANSGSRIVNTGVNNATANESLALSSNSQHQHAQFLGEASSALPNLDEICRSSGLPVPSEVEAKSGENKGRVKVTLSSDIPFLSEDVITFCRLYALSAGYMLDAVVNLDFASIETVWKAFWCTEEVKDSRVKQSLSQERLYALVSDSSVLQFVRLYDHTFYQSLAEVLIPNVLRPIPPTLTQAIRNFAKSLEGWMRQATHGLDATLTNLKVSAVSALAQTLRRYTSLNHLAQAARAVLKNSNQINQMLSDLNRVDFNNVQEQASWVCQCSDETVSQLEQDFKLILQKHASLEEWAQWLDTVVTSILQPLEGNSLAYTRAAHQLILKWSFYSSMVIRDLTLRSAASFGSFHLIRLLYDEYIFYLVEHKVAAHLGMTPVAVMGQMGRDLTQQYYSQSRLDLDYLGMRGDDVADHELEDDDDMNEGTDAYSTRHNNRRFDNAASKLAADSHVPSYLRPSANETKHVGTVQQSLSSNADTKSFVTSDNHLRIPSAHSLNDNDAVDGGGGGGGDCDDDDEEIDEYLDDDEEDADDSYGDESAMLKEAHASVLCRNSNLTSGGDKNNNNKKKAADCAILEDATNANRHFDDDGSDCGDGVVGDKDDQSMMALSHGELGVSNFANATVDDALAKSVDSSSSSRIGSCSPPSIVAVPNPVRKVVRVTTFCDSRQMPSGGGGQVTSVGHVVVQPNNKVAVSSNTAASFWTDVKTVDSTSFVVSTISTPSTTVKVTSNAEFTAVKRPKLS